MIAFAIVLVIIGAVLLAIASPRKGGNLEIETSDIKTNLPEITGPAKIPAFILGLVFIGIGLWIGVVLFVKSTEEPTPSPSQSNITSTPVTNPTILPNDTPIPPNITSNPVTNPTVLPTDTPIPPTKTPHPTPTPTATIDADPTVYDNFDNPDYNGSFNLGQWKIEDGTSDQFIQQNGVLMVTRENSEHGPARLIARKYHNFILEAPTFFEAKLMQSPDKYTGNVQLHLGANITDNEGGWSECDIDDGQSDCFDVWTWVKEQNYSVGQRFADYGVWHTYRIEVMPDTMTFTYYIDGQKVGSHIPVDAEKLKKARFVLRIGVYGKIVIGYIDDVRIGQIAK